MRLIAFLAFLLAPLAASAQQEACTLIADAQTGAVVYESGPACDTPHSPASTFKVPLALIGYETGLLEDPQTPAEPYRAAYAAPFEGWRRTTTPTTWLRDSVVWYSQVLTRRLGMEDFQRYVDAFAYGNRDLAGDPGKDNGLTHAWLSSSLQITPRQQVDFWHRLYTRTLPVSADTYAKTAATIQTFAAADGWTAHAKTGTAFADGRRNGNQFGWFAGWLGRGDAAYVFARLTYEQAPVDGIASRRTRASFLAEAPSLIPHQR